MDTPRLQKLARTFKGLPCGEAIPAGASEKHLRQTSACGSAAANLAKVHRGEGVSLWKPLGPFIQLVHFTGFVNMYA